MPRSKRYREISSKVEQGRAYPLPEAVKLAKATSYSNFDGSVELHVRLFGKKPEDKQFRAQVTLPHAVAKNQTVEILTEEKIDQIAKSGNTPADLYLAAPQLMPKVATIAKILGPKGKMPNPKSGTVTDKPEEKAKELQSGNLIELRADPTGIIHSSLGKVSWDEAKLRENIDAIIKIIPRTKIGSVTITSTMGPGISIAI